jgi:iron complex transport system ATP-binding protein
MMLEIRNGCFGYKNGRQVLDHVCFSANQGDLIAVLGPNGAGKTTLLRCMLGFLRWHEGDSLLDGKSIHSIPTRQLWKKIAYVPQAKNFTSSSTALEAVLLGRNSHISVFSQPSQNDVKLADNLMEKLNISYLREKRCTEMSGGELQMVLIARALAAEPEILVLDEPESNLDFRNQLIVLETMSRLAADGMTCIFNTHYPDHALQRANKALLLYRGGNTLFGETHRVVTEANIKSAFGVRAVIGEIETDENIHWSILPLGLAGEDTEIPAPEERRIAVISIILQSDSQAEQVNACIHEYSRYLIGRMGMPYREGGVFIIHVTLDAPASEINALVGKLSLLEGSSVKATYSKKICSKEENHD